MAGQLRIATGTAHTAARPFRVVIEVSGARPGDQVRIRLRQSAGMMPFWSGVAVSIIDANGEGLAAFEGVVLHGPNSIARLVADHEESAVPLRSDEIHIEVMP